MGTLSEEERRAAIARLLRKRGHATGPEAIPAVDASEPLPLSSAQKRFWFLHRLQPDRSLYNHPVALRVRGPLNIDHLESALNEIVARHEALRTRFEERDGVPFQRVQRSLEVRFERRSLTLPREDATSKVLDRAVLDVVRRPFDLRGGPLVRAAVLVVGRDDAVVVLCIHHIAVDAWSMGILLDEMSAAYAAFSADRPPKLPEVAVQYPAYAAWEQERLSAGWLAEETARYRERIAHRTPVLLRGAVLGAGGPNKRGARVSVHLSKKLLSALDTATVSMGCTPFVGLLAVFQVLIYRCFGRCNFLVGTPVANRTRLELERTVGCFANTALVACDLYGALTFRELLERTREAAAAAFAQQEVPLDRVLLPLDAKRDRWGDTLFNMMFVVQNAPRGQLRIAGAEVAPLSVDEGTAKFDLFLSLATDDDGIRGLFEVDTGAVGAAMAPRLLRAYAKLLECALAQMDTRIDRLSLTEDAPRPVSARTPAESEPATPWHDGEDMRALEARLCADPGVVDAACVRRVDRDGRGRLCVYAALRSRSNRLRHALEQALPDDGEPASIVEVSRVPRNERDVVDWAQLAPLPVLDAALVAACERALRARVPTDAVLVARAPPESRRRRITVGHAPRMPQSQHETARTTGAPAIAHGGPPVDTTKHPPTLVHALQRAAEEPGAGLVFVNAAGEAREESYADLRERALRAGAGLCALGVEPGQVVLLYLRRAEHHLGALWACLTRGLVPIAIAPSQDRNLPSAKLRAACADLDRPPIITGREDVEGVSALGRVVAWEHLEQHPKASPPRMPGPDEVAIMQLSSGSTGRSKIIPQTHRAILSQLLGAAAVNEFSSSDICLNWLPLDHVVPILTYHFRDVFFCSREIQVDPAYVLADPLRMLELWERYGVTHTWSPNFAFRWLAEARRGNDRHFDLGSMRQIMNAGEQVTWRTMIEFQDALQADGLAPGALQPAFGMAELCTCVTYNNDFRPTIPAQDGRRWVDLGPPIPGTGIRIVDDRGEVVREGTIGRIQFRGPMVTAGYFNNEEANQSALVGDGWFDSGDLGFLLSGRLTVTGRAKETIIIRGVNHSCYAIEEIAAGVEGVHTTLVAATAFRPEGAATEQLAVFYVADGSDDDSGRVRRTINERLARALGITADAVVPLGEGSFPRTTSGKIQRRALREQLESGELSDPQARSAEQSAQASTIPDWLYQETWVPRAADVEPARDTTVLVLSHDPALVSTLRTQPGVDVVVVRAGRRWEQRAADEFVVNVQRPRDFDAVLETLRRQGTGIDTIVYGWAAELPLSAALGVAAVERAHAEATVPLLHLLQALARSELGPLRLLITTHRAQAVTADESVDAERGMLVALAAAAEVENPKLQLSCVDFDAGRLPGALMREAALAWPEFHVAYRRGRRYVQRLERVDPRRSAPGRPEARTGSAGETHLEVGAYYAICGGGGPIGRRLGEWLCDEWSARVLVLGRSEVTAPPTARGERIFRVADVTDAAAVQLAIDEAGERFQRPLRGVFHLASASRDVTIRDEEPEPLWAAMRAKVLGTVSLAEVMQHHPGAFWVGFGSVNGVFGGHGAGAYGAANRFLIDFARDERLPITPRLTLSFSRFEGGLGSEAAAALRDRGYFAVGPADGLRSMQVALSLGMQHAVVGLDGAAPPIARHTTDAVASGERLRAWVVLDSSDPAVDVGPLEQTDAFGSRVTVEVSRCDVLPRTSNGRAVDAEPVSEPAAPPQGCTEQAIAAIFGRYLGIESPGRHESFFALGGHSLLAAQVVSSLERELGVSLSVATLFEHPTIAALAAVAKRGGKGSVARSEPLTPVGAPRRRGPLSLAQEAIYAVHRAVGAPNNVSGAYLVDGALTPQLLGRNLARAVRRQGLLRTTFEESGGEVAQVIRSSFEPRLDWLDLSNESDAEQREVFAALHRDALWLPLDPNRGTLLRVALLRLDEEAHLLLLVLHHLIADAGSLLILLRELLDPAATAPLPLQYIDYCVWQRDRIASASLGEDLDYWSHRLARVVPLRWSRRSEEQTFGCVRFALPAALSDALMRFTTTLPCTMFALVAALVALALRRITGSDDLVIGTLASTRTRPELEPLVGPFVNTLPIRVQFERGRSLRAQVEHVARRAAEAFDHRELPFAAVWQHAAAVAGVSRDELFRVMVLWSGPTLLPLGVGGVVVKPPPWAIEASPGPVITTNDLIIEATTRDGRIRLAFTHRTATIDGDAVEQLYEEVLRQAEALASCSR